MWSVSGGPLFLVARTPRSIVVVALAQVQFNSLAFDSHVCLGIDNFCHNLRNHFNFWPKFSVLVLMCRRSYFIIGMTLLLVKFSLKLGHVLLGDRHPYKIRVKTCVRKNVGTQVRQFRHFGWSVFAVNGIDTSRRKIVSIFIRIYCKNHHGPHFVR